MGNGVWRDYPSNPREFDRWLKANAVLGQSRRSESWRWRWRACILQDAPTEQRHCQSLRGK